MWKGDHCPVCGEELVKRDSFPDCKVDNFYVVKCSAWAGGNWPHYQLGVDSLTHVAYYEGGIIFPYLIESYLKGNSNVYKWNEMKKCFSRKVILDVPYIQIPWDNLEAARDKIRLYLLMS